MKAPSLPPVAPPQQLGKYEVGAKIGGGGMATIFLGRQVKDGHEELVALKVIRDELAHDEQFRAMFEDEAKILAQLSHPNIIRTLDYGVTGHHRYIAMELLSGRTFADVWDLLAATGEKLSLRLAAWICARVAEGLHSAHELHDESGASLGVIHRDVNPTNVFLTHNGDVKLIDFGLAKAKKRTSKSVDGIVKGKIPYLAPEQAKGEPIDRRIDLYALGTTLWEASTMKRLFKRDTDVETLRAIQAAKVPDPRELIPGFPEGLYRIIEKALRQDREQRYATALDMQRELDDFVATTDPSEMKAELTLLLVHHFPGQEAKHVKWLRDVASVRKPRHTLRPPAPVPTVSSSLLEETDSVPQQPTAEAEPPARREAREAPETSDANPEPPVDPRNAPTAKSPAIKSFTELALDPAAGKRLWASIAIVVLVVVAVAWFLTSGRR